MSVLFRPAMADDVAGMSVVLTASIIELCAADHRGDAAAIAAWTRNKTETGVAAMLGNPDMLILVAERDAEVVAVGAVSRAGGEIALNYVAPSARFSGISTALLAQLEQALAAMGHAEGRLESTLTARPFYQSRGWQPDGPQAQGRVVNGYPMRKRLSG